MYETLLGREGFRKGMDLHSGPFEHSFRFLLCRNFLDLPSCQLQSLAALCLTRGISSVTTEML